VAKIARLESEANADPDDISKQLALYQSLIETQVKAGYELVITRWERMCELVNMLAFLHLWSYRNR